MIKNLIIEYCRESSIHGMRYLIDKRKTLLERIFWVIFVAFSVMCCCWFTYNLYISSRQSSIIVTISNRPLAITKLEFPSVTICSSLAFNLTVLNAQAALLNGSMHQVSEYLGEDEVYALIAQFCYVPDHRSGPLKQFDYVKTLLKTNLRMNYLRSCRFGVQREQCRDDFQEIITNMGVCYVYNSLRTKDLFESHNGSCFDFSENLIQIINDSYAIKNIVGPYERGRLETSFQIEDDLFNESTSCKPHVDGFLVALRSPKDVININSADLRIKEDYATDLSLSPQVLESSSDLRAYRVEDRECYFENERKLYFLRYYTQENCHFECLTNFTLKGCGCVLYFMPRLKVTPICLGAAALACADEIEQDYDNMGRGPCNCYSLCNSVTFQVNVATHKLNLNKFRKDKKLVETRIAVFTKEKSVYPLFRSQLYGFSDYIANFGGLLGLFLGVSILSIIELLYYVIVRPFVLGCYQNSERRDFKHAEKVQNNNLLHVKPYSDESGDPRKAKTVTLHNYPTHYDMMTMPYYDFRKE